MGISKVAFPRRLQLPNRDSTGAKLSNAIKCRCRVNDKKIEVFAPPRQREHKHDQEGYADDIHKLLLGCCSVCSGYASYRRVYHTSPDAVALGARQHNVSILRFTDFAPLSVPLPNDTIEKVSLWEGRRSLFF